MPTIRPIAHEARLSIIDHLDELRSRVLWIVAVYVLAFGLCFSQNDRILEVKRFLGKLNLGEGRRVFKQIVGVLGRNLGTTAGFSDWVESLGVESPGESQPG